MPASRRELEVDWRPLNVDVRKDLLSLTRIQDDAPTPGIAVIAAVPGPSLRQKYALLATPFRPDIKDSPNGPRSRFVLGVQMTIGNRALWVAGLLPYGEGLGRITYDGSNYEALAVRVDMCGIKRAFLGVMQAGAYERLETMGVGLDGEVSGEPKRVMESGRVYGISQNIPFVDGPQVPKE